MEYLNNNNKLEILLCNRIDSLNATAIEQEIFDILGKESFTELVLDAKNLEYISSAGLRIVLKIKKQASNVEIVNVSSEVYDIFEMTGFTEMIDIKKGIREFDVTGLPVIGKGAKGTVYRYSDEIIVKVYNKANSIDDIKHEHELARLAFVSGIPTAISFDTVKVGDKYGSVFELLDAKSLSQLIASDESKLAFCAGKAVDIIKIVHSTPCKKQDLPNAKDSFLAKAKNLENALEGEEYQKLVRLISDVSDTNNLIHGDYHTNNIMFQNNDALLIDMDTLCYGNKIFELANIYVTYVLFGIKKREIEEKFLGFNYDLALKFWDLFIKLYFNDDEKMLKDALKKIELVGLVRFYYHFSRRNANNEYNDEVDFGASEIKKLLKEVDSLEL